MTKRNVSLTVFILLALGCLVTSFSLFKYYGEWSLWLLFLGWGFIVWGVISYYKAWDDGVSDYHHDGDHSHH